MMRALVVLIAVVAIGAGTQLLAQAGGGGAGGCHGPLTNTPGRTVTMQDACFSPTVIRVAPGTVVTWVNRDALAHSVIGAGGQFNGGTPQAGTSFTRQFDRPGVYPYFCAQHPGMIGAVVVGNGI